VHFQFEISARGRKTTPVEKLDRLFGPPTDFQRPVRISGTKPDQRPARCQPAPDGAGSSSQQASRQQAAAAHGQANAAADPQQLASRGGLERS
jgi:hypothetical protein